MQEYSSSLELNISTLLSAELELRRQLEQIEWSEHYLESERQAMKVRIDGLTGKLAGSIDIDRQHKQDQERV